MVIICKRVIFYSQNDESAFFEWINKMKFVDRFSQAYDELYLHISKENLKDDELNDLIAFFYRYKIRRMKQLAAFLNEKNRKWFYENKDKYWHKKIFGD